jgi:hypothetical protein
MGTGGGHAAPVRHGRGSWRRQAAVVVLAAGLQLMQLNKARGENHVDYRFESYKEENGRIEIETHSALFGYQPASWLDLKGEMVYDAISGATPTGAPPLSKIKVINIFTGQPLKGLSKDVPVVDMEDTRYAGGFQAGMSYDRHRITPGFAYSEESDYISRGLSLNYAVEFNEKNTTLNLGWSHAADKSHDWRGNWQSKDTDDIIVGVNQLLGPKSVMTANFTFGRSHGYLSDPYKVVYFDGYTIFKDPNDPRPVIPPSVAEIRPKHRERYIGYVSFTQHVTPLAGSAEGSYRIFQDSYGITAHTVGLTWYQTFSFLGAWGKRVVLAPTFRYYRQDAADFYVTKMKGVPGPTTPDYFSADYRLSEMETFTYGVSLSARVCDWCTVDLGYKRYEMYGLDGRTSPTAYPKADICTLGARLWF